MIHFAKIMIASVAAAALAAGIGACGATVTNAHPIAAVHRALRADVKRLEMFRWGPRHAGSPPCVPVGKKAAPQASHSAGG
jgi:hypothetical protein